MTNLNLIFILAAFSLLNINLYFQGVSNIICGKLFLLKVFLVTINILLLKFFQKKLKIKRIIYLYGTLSVIFIIYYILLYFHVPLRRSGAILFLLIGFYIIYKKYKASYLVFLNISIFSFIAFFLGSFFIIDNIQNYLNKSKMLIERDIDKKDIYNFFIEKNNKK